MGKVRGMYVILWTIKIFKKSKGFLRSLGSFWGRGTIKELALRSECWELQGSSRQTVPPGGSAGALHSYPTTVPASFLTEARSWGGASSRWNLEI